MNLKEQIEKYEPCNEQEAKDKETMLKYINTFDDVLTRNNEFGHFTASSWVVNKERTKVLMIYHNIYKSWSCKKRKICIFTCTFKFDISIRSGRK